MKTKKRNKLAMFIEKSNGLSRSEEWGTGDSLYT